MVQMDQQIGVIVSRIRISNIITITQNHHHHHHHNHQILTVQLGHEGSSAELNVLAFNLLPVYLYYKVTLLKESYP